MEAKRREDELAAREAQASALAAAAVAEAKRREDELAAREAQASEAAHAAALRVRALELAASESKRHEDALLELASQREAELQRLQAASSAASSRIARLDESIARTEDRRLKGACVAQDVADATLRRNRELEDEVRLLRQTLSQFVRVCARCTCHNPPGAQSCAACATALSSS